MEFPLDKGGDVIMDEDTQLFLGQESSAGGFIPSWRDSSDAVSEDRPEAMSDSVPSLVGAGPNSGLSLMATDESGNLSYSSSGSSLMSVTGYMLGAGTHLPMSTATVMRGSTSGVIRSSTPGMMISVAPDLSQPGSVPTRHETRMPVVEHLAQIPLPGSPEAKRASATAWARFTAEQEQRKATEARLQAALDNNRREQTTLREEYQKLQATNTQMSDA
ncbi:unnamed protein product [Phytophthora fragariaefolia]|uniref:Unnamed protein product n=1 Tax=Phytophthora fragariaefolia TaxID=1490495 RepID=A0A9W7D4K6_9STRA|nr:unnamed protein product [Phytophthora fragariaefolia]